MNKICRLCLSKDKDLHPVFCLSGAEDHAVNLDALVTMCTTVVISKSDKLSTKICSKCLNFINEWFQFRQRCLETDSGLKAGNCGSTGKKTRFQCKQCPSAFQTYEDLKLHRRRVHLRGMVQKKVVWHCCERDFASKLQFQKHMKSVHPAQKPYVCDECGKTDFVSAGTLRRHKLLHSGRYGCEACGKTFTCHAILRIHQRDKHENDHPFVCDVCGKAFVTELLMKYHQRFHTGEKKYVCDVCGIAVATSSSLSKHKKRHTDDKPHVCDFCGKGFIVRARLVEHIRMHTGERPYTCDVCGKAFTMNDKLTRHKKTHSGLKPFFCDVCGNTYSTNHGLTVHRKTHQDGHG